MKASSRDSSPTSISAPAALNIRRVELELFRAAGRRRNPGRHAPADLRAEIRHGANDGIGAQQGDNIRGFHARHHRDDELAGQRRSHRAREARERLRLDRDDHRIGAMRGLVRIAGHLVRAGPRELLLEAVAQDQGVLRKGRAEAAVERAADIARADDRDAFHSKSRS